MRAVGISNAQLEVVTSVCCATRRLVFTMSMPCFTAARLTGAGGCSAVMRMFLGIRIVRLGAQSELTGSILRSRYGEDNRSLRSRQRAGSQRQDQPADGGARQEGAGGGDEAYQTMRVGPKMVGAWEGARYQRRLEASPTCIRRGPPHVLLVGDYSIA